ncbi:hypothetical protein SALIVB_1085 [Streptococcus salivarius CCHSS3]|nr:hypothetical protein SALIVB_1085 [Streptococcus salivarius CCHSS3]
MVKNTMSKKMSMPQSKKDKNLSLVLKMIMSLSIMA